MYLPKDLEVHVLWRICIELLQYYFSIQGNGFLHQL